MLKRIAILGSTGSIGTQTLEVVTQHPDRFQVVALTAQNSVDLLIKQALQFRPTIVAIGNKSLYARVNQALSGTNIRVVAGDEGLAEAATLQEADLVVTAMVGASGLNPTIQAILAGKHIALANKETLVIAGRIVGQLARKMGVNIFPIDSEHSAIQQCLLGEELSSVEKLILTASGGPFYGKTIEQLAVVTRQEALKHPNWAMGQKITIDSATLMNKGLEVIEARWLFGIEEDRIDVVVHPQSIIHSMVAFCDGSIKAQLGIPDMRLPIQFALSYPERLKNDFPKTNILELKNLTFHKPDLEAFPCLALAFKALSIGKNAACVVNAANEVAVDAFLNGSIGFMQIPESISWALDMVPPTDGDTLEELLQTDQETRRLVRGKLNLMPVA